jgi:hypothetical protein
MFSSPQFPAYTPKARAPKPPARIHVTSDIARHAHHELTGTFDADVTESEIREFVYGVLGGRDLRINFGARTFSGIRHTD